MVSIPLPPPPQKKNSNTGVNAKFSRAVTNGSCMIAVTAKILISELAACLDRSNNLVCVTLYMHMYYVCS